jgi:hypothetical protein
MTAFLIIVGSVFALIVMAHVARIFVEPQMAREPWFWLLTVIAAALSGWAWRLLWISRRPKNSGRGVR